MNIIITRITSKKLNKTSHFDFETYQVLLAFARHKLLVYANYQQTSI